MSIEVDNVWYPNTYGYSGRQVSDPIVKDYWCPYKGRTHMSEHECKCQGIVLSRDGNHYIICDNKERSERIWVRKVDLQSIEKKGWMEKVGDQIDKIWDFMIEGYRA